ncbi:response regulator transcription factor [Mucilaginibacter sp. CAU 1740]|uniref:response regulator transcription factor n=1 Tax=Mucilaginibacter sp. CAU 1740 TaxID=3140365 RepID=UPI00325C298D
MNKIKVLLVEDEAVLASVVKETLDARGFDLTLASNGVEGWNLFHHTKPDVCVIDIMMPRKDGYSLVEDIRKIDEFIPIIFLTAKTQISDIVKGFDVGADDYLKKPFSMEELIARLKSLVRRRNYKDIPATKSLDTTLFRLGHFTFDNGCLELIEKDQLSIGLSQREADLLRLLVKNKNQLLERKTALISIWGDDNFYNSRSMDVYITRLRKYLSSDHSLQILNIRGFGYKLIEQSDI